jgi:type II secretory pathway pseudopilin PulG
MKTPIYRFESVRRESPPVVGLRGFASASRGVVDWSVSGAHIEGTGHKPHSVGGWTLIELIGVLAVLAVLVGTLAPVLLRDLERRQRAVETRHLEMYAEALIEHVIRMRTIPDHTGFAAAIAVESGIPANSVLTNHIGLARAILIDPLLRIGTNDNQVLPYTQGLLGSIQPISPRILIVSSLSAPLPNGIVNGVASSTSIFNELWELQANTVPPSWNWDGSGADLLIQRINLSDTFYPVVLNNNAIPPPRYSLDGGASDILQQEVQTGFYIRSTVLDLRGSDNVIQTREVIQQASSYVYEFGIWRGRLFLGAGTRRLAGMDLQAAAELFVSAPNNPNAKPFSNPTTTATVILSMQDYMEKYMAWADANFPSQSSAKKPVTDAQSVLANATKDLIFKP